ncbi:hypothetical protein [Rhodovarius lipocyclicus]|uniref:hypothetical protein n=1 Tax=Rhodovarius lipocyclicus TaxID=268410 RepID=UPI001358451D|nr:hypothetical protein [Rhodovarius lipocyclicus]
MSATEDLHKAGRMMASSVLAEQRNRAADEAARSEARARLLEGELEATYQALRTALTISAEDRTAIVLPAGYQAWAASL